MNFKSFNCVITGGSSATGSALKAYLIERGATVISTLRPRNSSDDLIQLKQNDYQITMDPLDPGSIHTTIPTITNDLFGSMWLGDLKWVKLWKTILKTTGIICGLIKSKTNGALNKL